MTGIITWSEDRQSGRGMLTLAWDDGRRETAEWDGPPISASSDSDAVAAAFGREAASHDGASVFVHG